MLNNIVVQGRLTRDPELKATNNGTSVVLFTIACERDFKNKETGEKVTDFIDCVAWKHTAEFVHKFFAKGRMVFVQGRIEQQKWVDKDGNNRITTRVIAENVYFGDSKETGTDVTLPNQGYQPPNGYSYKQTGYSSPPLGTQTPSSTSYQENFTVAENVDEETIPF